MQVRSAAAALTYGWPDATRRMAAGSSLPGLDTLGSWRRSTTSTSPLERLSDRERHVRTLVGRGMPTREIAEHLGLSRKTVDAHYEHIKAKLGVRNARELIRLAVTLTGNGPS